VTAVVGAVDGLDAGPELPMVAGADLVDRHGYMLTDLCRPRWLHRVFTVAAGRPNRLGDYRRTLAIMVKAKDELSGAMTRHGPGKPLTSQDRARLRRGERDARAILRQAGARDVYRTGFVAVHPGGTAKIGDVVDRNLETEVRDLFVCDASVIPVAWGLPPTLTVMALGRRLARHLAAVSTIGPGA
jgi:choline dehydrogenase-like flavoprotein